MKEYNFLFNKGVRCLMFASVLACGTLGVVGSTSVEAAELNSKAAQLLKSEVRLASGVSYIDTTGMTKEVDIPKGAQVSLSASSTTITIKFNGQTHSLKNVREVTFKNITVTNLIPFYLHGVTKVTLEGVDFQRGVDFSGMKDVKTMVIKDSKFGSTDYSLAIHVASSLTELVIDNSTLSADLRIYSNKSLASATVSNSLLQDDAQQSGNKIGYYTNYVNNRFERPKGMRIISSGGMSAADIFHMNPSGEKIADTKFNASKPGEISYTDANGTVDKISVPAYTAVKTVNDVGNKITIKLANGYSTVLNDAKELSFNNVDIQTHVAFTQVGLKLEKLSFVNSRTQLIDVAYSNTMKTFEIYGSEVSQSSGYVSVYNNKAIENFIMKDSSVKGSSGYISVYNIPTMKKFVMENDYTYGYLSTYNLGSAVLELSNSQYDDYISSTNVIEGAVVTKAPVISSDNVHIYKTASKDVSKTDAEFLADINASTDDGTLITSNFDDKILNEIGSYKVKLTAKNANHEVEKEVVIIVAHENKSEIGSKGIVSADSFRLTITQARGLTIAEAKSDTYGKVTAFDIEDAIGNTMLGADITAQVSVDAVELARINNARITGKMPLTFILTHKGETIKKIVEVVIIP